MSIAALLVANGAVLVSAHGAESARQVMAERAPAAVFGSMTHHVAAGVSVELHLPPGPGPHPVLLYAHGGGWTSGTPTDGLEDLGVSEVIDHGWAIASIGYRLADPATGVTAQHQRDDVAAVLGWIRTAGPDVGLGDRVVAMGHSSGAHIVALAAADAAPTARPDTVVLVSGVFDFLPDVVDHPLLRPAAAAALGCHPSDCGPVEALEPVAFADRGDPPVVLVHGADDRVVTSATSVRYAEALRRADVAVDLHVVSGGGHSGAVLAAAIRAVLTTVMDGSTRR